MPDDEGFTEKTKQRWGLYATVTPLSVWCITEPTNTHPTWWPSVWQPFPGLQLFKTGVYWDHYPTSQDVVTALEAAQVTNG